MVSGGELNTGGEVLAVYVAIRIPNAKLYWCHSRSKKVIGGLKPLLDSLPVFVFPSSSTKGHQK